MPINFTSLEYPLKSTYISRERQTNRVRDIQIESEIKQEESKNKRKTWKDKEKNTKIDLINHNVRLHLVIPRTLDQTTQYIT